VSVLLREKRNSVSTTYVVHNGADVANEEEEEDLERYLPTVPTLPKLPTLPTDGTGATVTGVTYQRYQRCVVLETSHKPSRHVAVAIKRNAYASYGGPQVPTFTQFFSLHTDSTITPQPVAAAENNTRVGLARSMASAGSSASL